ncbi:hypothetical protein DXG03_008526 [Asterophora parasitica]|uniref:SMAD/FHA domain-containing protein n=1 Tax=Asterophora parasitica TaxID=117018 RepID=A0A9P7KE29_9AGAR|nr:hypothetical protein DXG03_008526 [Asterophora parasitica]
MDAGNESPPLRSTILGSFLRGRPRNSSQSHIITDARELSPSPPQPPSPSGFAAHRRSSRPVPVQTSASTTTNAATTPTTPSGLGFSHMLRRRRSAGNIAATSPVIPATSPVIPPQVSAAHDPVTNFGPSIASSSAPAVTSPGASGSHRIRLVPHIDSRRTLRFDAITRDLKDGDPALRIGRFTDRSGLGLAAVNALGTNRLAFKSKVVSRAHAEIWVEGPGRFFIKDTKSSSGTFLNHVRLSPANTESKPFLMKDGDVLQLGVDYQGGAEDIYKSVKIRVELGREWQAGANAFNTNTLKILKTLSAPAKPTPTAISKPASSSIPDCCICLFGVTIRQALFIAPCSHTFHYKCIRPLLETHHPAFSCPLCRTFADLEEDVEVEVEVEEEEADGEVDEESIEGGSPAPPQLLEEDDHDHDEVMLDAPGGIDSEGSGSGGRGDSPALVVVVGELGEGVEGDAMEVDGTVGPGVKRKR